MYILVSELVRIFYLLKIIQSLLFLEVKTVNNLLVLCIFPIGKIHRLYYTLGLRMI
jgi:hypothetical protein